jgi:hypothetical protein
LGPLSTEFASSKSSVVLEVIFVIVWILKGESGKAVTS